MKRKVGLFLFAVMVAVSLGATYASGEGRLGVMRRRA
jgi:hypothetical protein